MSNNCKETFIVYKDCSQLYNDLYDAFENFRQSVVHARFEPDLNKRYKRYLTCNHYWFWENPPFKKRIDLAEFISKHKDDKPTPVEYYEKDLSRYNDGTYRVNKRFVGLDEVIGDCVYTGNELHLSKSDFLFINNWNKVNPEKCSSDLLHNSWLY